MNILIIILIGLIFFIINYKIIRVNVNDNNVITKPISAETFINFNENNENSLEYNNLDDDVKLELNELYGLNNNILLLNHNEYAKKYMLV